MSHQETARFPAELLNWAGNRSGGVRRLFDDGSGRPDKIVLVTNLLDRLKAWAAARAKNDPATPRAVLLVGGPGNGKTEAIESTVRWLDDESGANKRLVEALTRAFLPADGLVPRIVTTNLDNFAGRQGLGTLSIVQDASVVTAGISKSAARHLLEELSRVASDGSAEIYLCCVNRGVLDDALIEAIDTGADNERKLLEAVTQAVSLFPNAPSCWPLDGFPDFAVWPMDVESLFVRPKSGENPPAETLLDSALAEEKWLPAGTCPAGPMCPFCGSRELLRRERERYALQRILRWYEVSSGKRWSFRDLYSLISYLLAGYRASARGSQSNPCDWAASLIEADKQAQRKPKPSKEISSAIYQLVAAQYQHALFHKWDRDSGASLLRDIKELGLADDNTAMGLHWFLASRRG